MGKQNKSITLRESDIKRMKSEATRTATRYAFSLFFTVMRDKFGYGKVRLTRIYNNLNELADSVNEGYCTVQELEEALKDEVGIELRRSK